MLLDSKKPLMCCCLQKRYYVLAPDWAPLNAEPHAAAAMVKGYSYTHDKDIKKQTNP